MLLGEVSMISRFALVAAAGMLLGGALTSAKAADLGGGCCADLEERVAELEATTARKGNRVVSLQIYGQVNKALMYWDDGRNSDVYVVDNTLASSRFGFFGVGNVSPDVTVGYNMEMEINNERADEVYNPRSPFVPDETGLLRLRKNYLYFESKKLGRISLGHLNAASDGASEVVLGNSLRNADPNIGSALCATDNGGGALFICHGQLNASTKQRAYGGYALDRQWAEDFTTDRVLETGVRYDSPSVYGFILSASWDHSDFADVALRFKKEFGNLRVAAAIAYQWDNRAQHVTKVFNFKSENVAGSASVMHMPTGLYTAFAAGQRDFEEEGYEDSSFWYVQAGIERKLLPFGTTTIYGEYGNYDSFYLPELATVPGLAVDSEATRWGFGVNQKIDAAAMDIYAHVTVWSFDGNVPSVWPGDELNDLTTVVVGSRIRF